MPNKNASLPNPLLSNWMRGYIVNNSYIPTPQPPEPPEPVYDKDYYYNFFIPLKKNSSSNDEKLILNGEINLTNAPNTQILVYYVNNFQKKFLIESTSFDFKNDIITINLDSSYYSYKQINILVIVTQIYAGTILNKSYTCIYNTKSTNVPYNPVIVSIK